MRVSYIGEPDRGLAKRKSYDVDFRNEGSQIFVEVAEIKGDYVGTFVYVDMRSFLDAWGFGVAKRGNNLVRKHTDFEHTTYFTLGEAAEFFGVSKNTINNWVLQGRIPIHHRVGVQGHRRFARADCLKLYAALREGFS